MVLTATRVWLMGGHSRVAKALDFTYAVGAMLAISAIDSVTNDIPMIAVRAIQMDPAVPPFWSDKTPLIRENSQEQATITLYPQMLKK